MGRTLRARILVALTYFRYAIDPSGIVNYFQSIPDKGSFVKPPLVIIDPMIFFFYTVTVWSIVLAGLRIALERSVKRALGDLSGCFFSFFCAYLLTNYSTNVFTEQLVGAYFVVSIGLLIIVNAVLSLGFPEKKHYT